MSGAIPVELRDTIARAAPGFRPLALIDTGVDSRVVEAAGPDGARHIFKFLRDAQAARLAILARLAGRAGLTGSAIAKSRRFPRGPL